MEAVIVGITIMAVGLAIVSIAAVVISERRRRRALKHDRVVVPQAVKTLKESARTEEDFHTFLDSVSGVSMDSLATDDALMHELVEAFEEVPKRKVP